MSTENVNTSERIHRGYQASRFSRLGLVMAAVFGALLVAALTTATFAQPAPDYQSLVGKWAGHRSGPRGRGAESLDVKTVAGTKFTGTVFIASSQNDDFTNREIEVNGQISGNPGEETLQFSALGRVWILTRSGDVLLGKRYADRTTFDISLTRHK